MRARAIALAAWSALCVLVSHQIAYYLSYTDAHTRAHALEASGHAWYALLLPALVLGAGIAAASTWFDARRATTTPPQSTARSLYVVSVAGFLLLELFERFMHLRSADAVLHNLVHGTGYLPVLLGVLLLACIIPIARWARTVIERLAYPRTAPAPIRATNRSRVPTRRWVDRPHALAAPRGPPGASQNVSLCSTVSFR